MKHLIQSALSIAALSTSLGSNAAEQAKFSPQQICKAAIATIMGRDPKIIRVNKVDADVIYVSYTRADDGTLWSQRCRIDGAKVIWATSTGRWREHPLDEVITFASTPKTLTVSQKFSDGSSSAKSFTRAELGGN